VRRFCAWCRTALDGGPARARRGEEVSHGICLECQRVFFGEPQDGSLDQFLDRLQLPVLVMDEDMRVQTANRKALEVLGTDLPRVRLRLGGDVLECARSRLPGGCGRTEHCAACVIRGSVESTFRTGEEHQEVVAEQPIHPGSGGEEQVRFLISTKKSGDAVLLRIDQVGERSFRTEQGGDETG